MKILLIEDNPDHSELIKDACSTAFRHQCTLTLEKYFNPGIEKLLHEEFDICLCDLQLPDSSIENSVNTLKALDTTIPIVVLTSLNDSELGHTLIHQGVQDYLPKEDLNPSLLHRICTYAIERKKQDLALRERASDQQAFCHSLSHDFKSPIRNIGQLTVFLKESLARHTTFSPQEQLYFELLDNKTSVILELIEGLYQYLRADLSDNNYESVNLNDLLSEVIKFIDESLLQNAEIESEPLPEVYGIRSQLFVLFQNLINNALIYNDKIPTVKIDAYKQQECIDIRIRDNGIGIPLDKQKLIFRPFQRLHSQEKYKGSGLGLSIVKRIVENHHGQLSLESSEGLGTTFIISLPIDQNEKYEDTKQRADRRDSEPFDDDDVRSEYCAPTRDH